MHFKKPFLTTDGWTGSKQCQTKKDQLGSYTSSRGNRSQWLGLYEHTSGGRKQKRKVREI